MSEYDKSKAQIDFEATREKSLARSVRYLSGKSECTAIWRDGAHEIYVRGDGSTFCRACGEELAPPTRKSHGTFDAAALGEAVLTNKTEIKGEFVDAPKQHLTGYSTLTLNSYSMYAILNTALARMLGDEFRGMKVIAILKNSDGWGIRFGKSEDGDETSN